MATIKEPQLASIKTMKSGFRPRRLARVVVFLSALVAASLAIAIEGEYVAQVAKPPEAASDSSQRTPGPAPAMPAFAFYYAGKFVLDGGATTIILMKGDDIYLVKAGDALAGGYRVEEVGADYIKVTYLPLNKKQHVAFSSILPPARTEGSTIGLGSSPVTLTQETGQAASTADGERFSTSAEARESEARATGTPAASTQAGGTAVVPFGFPKTGQQSTTSIPAVEVGGAGGPTTSGTATGGSGGMVISPPISQMPMSPPTTREMPILPTPSGTMPMTPPTPGASMPIIPLGGTLPAAPAPRR